MDVERLMGGWRLTQLENPRIVLAPTRKWGKEE